MLHVRCKLSTMLSWNKDWSLATTSCRHRLQGWCGEDVLRYLISGHRMKGSMLQACNQINGKGYV